MTVRQKPTGAGKDKLRGTRQLAERDRSFSGGGSTTVTAALSEYVGKKNGRAKLPKDGVVSMVITPDIAGDWLGRNTMNRKMRDVRVVKLAEEIKAGRWFPNNGETIKFSKTGKILDGQHRLCAVVVAGVPIESFVAFGIDEEAYRTIDQGLIRRVADALFVKGEEDSIRELSAALNAMYRWLSTGSFVYLQPPSTEEAMQVLQSCPNLRESVTVAKRVKKKLPGSIWGVTAVIHYLANEVEADDCKYFFEKLIDGVGLTVDDPIYYLRERLIQPISNAGMGFRIQQEIGVIMAKTWNAYREGKAFNSRSLRFYPDDVVPELI